MSKHNHHLSLSFCDTEERDDASFMKHNFGGYATRRGFPNQQAELVSALRFAEDNDWRATVGVANVEPMPNPLQKEVSVLKANIDDLKKQHKNELHDKEITVATLHDVIERRSNGS